MAIYLGLNGESTEFVVETWNNSNVLTELVSGFYFADTYLNSCGGMKDDSFIHSFFHSFIHSFIPFIHSFIQYSV
jgi:hypothetical protein